MCVQMGDIRDAIDGCEEKKANHPKRSDNSRLQVEQQPTKVEE